MIIVFTEKCIKTMITQITNQITPIKNIEKLSG